MWIPHSPVSHRTFQIILLSSVSGVSHTLINATFYQLLSSLTTAGYMPNPLEAHFPMEKMQSRLEREGSSYLDTYLPSINKTLIISTYFLSQVSQGHRHLSFSIGFSCIYLPSCLCYMQPLVYTPAKGRRLADLYSLSLSEVPFSLSQTTLSIFSQNSAQE